MQEHDRAGLRRRDREPDQALPPELLRKGRFDEIFFVDLPARPEREADLPPSTSRARRADPAAFDLARSPRRRTGSAGAEIEQAIVSALYEARAARIPLDTAGLMVALRSTRPLSVVRAEPIAALRAWAAGRCVPAD